MYLAKPERGESQKNYSHVIGRIYEYFLNKFAKNIASDDGVFFTPKSLVKMIVNILEPSKRILFDKRTAYKRKRKIYTQGLTKMCGGAVATSLIAVNHHLSPSIAIQQAMLIYFYN